MKESWKEPREGSEREHETYCWQASRDTLFTQGVDRVLFVERSGELLYIARLMIFISGAEEKSSLNRAFSSVKQTRNRVIYPWAGWSLRKSRWRTEPTCVEKCGDDLWIGEKFQSNTEIAGFPRNSFRASLEMSLTEVKHWTGEGPEKDTESYQTKNAV